jgi:hypothetical protein
MEATTLKQLKMYIKLNLQEILIENDVKPKYEYDEYIYSINNLKEYHVIESLSFYHISLLDTSLIVHYTDFWKYSEK